MTRMSVSVNSILGRADRRESDEPFRGDEGFVKADRRGRDVTHSLAHRHASQIAVPNRMMFK